MITLTNYIIPNMLINFKVTDHICDKISLLAYTIYQGCYHKNLFGNENNYFIYST